MATWAEFPSLIRRVCSRGRGPGSEPPEERSLLRGAEPFLFFSLGSTHQLFESFRGGRLSCGDGSRTRGMALS